MESEQKEAQAVLGHTVVEGVEQLRTNGVVLFKHLFQAPKKRPVPSCPEEPRHVLEQKKGRLKLDNPAYIHQR